MTRMQWTRWGRTAADLMHRYATAGSPGADVPVARIMGQLVPLRSAATVAGGDDSFDGVELVLAWAGPGGLTWQQAEALLVLDRTTPWEAGTRA